MPGFFLDEMVSVFAHSGWFRRTVMHVTMEITSGIIRVYDKEQDAIAGRPFKAVITAFIDDKTATLKGALGKLSKADMIGIRNRLALMGIEKIRMKRSLGRRLPQGNKISEGGEFAEWEIQVARHSIPARSARRA